MTRIKMCGLRRAEDIDAVNELLPEYIGFVFFSGSKRYIAPEAAGALRAQLDPGIRAVGVFVDEEAETVAGLLNSGVIDLAQLHGHENEEYLAKLRKLADRPLVRAFRIRCEEDVRKAMESSAEHILLDGERCLVAEVMP